MRGSPANIDIPAFIKKITEKHFNGAYNVITDTNLLPSVCGRVCPQEAQCEGVCTVGQPDTKLESVAIGRLERFIGDMAIKEGWENVPYIEPSGYKVGIVGAGPAGMACAADMAKAGCEVIVYEAFHTPGGVLKYGIPDFRLPNDVIDAEIQKLRNLGVRFECNTLVGRLFTIEQMVTEMGFHAVFIGTGAGYPSFMGIPGESLNGVLSANELLTRCNLMRARDFPHFDTPLQPGKHVAVIGGEEEAENACAAYAHALAEKPLDLVCMGIGENGHLAFNDPPVADFSDPHLVKLVELDAACRQQQVNDGCFTTLEDVPTHALTLTIPALLGAAAISCVVPGDRKAAAVAQTLRGPVSTECPASILRTHANAMLHVDPAALSQMPS